jgi:hypothetical protein
MLKFDGNGFIDFRSSVQACTLSESDFATVKSIKSLLKRDSYSELFSIDSHLLLLDSIRKKMSVISAGEASCGIINWSAREQISDVKDVMKTLRELRHRFFTAL